jgi:uncharacterized BrkB/YihY/UPF0761 family membrane protein
MSRTDGDGPNVDGPNVDGPDVEGVRTDPSPFGRLVQATNAHVEPVKQRLANRLSRYQHVPVVDVVVATYRRDHDSAGSLLGSAIAFRMFQFFVPFLLFVIGVAGFVSGFLSAKEVDKTAGISGGLAQQVQAAVDHHGQGRWVAVLLGLWGMVFAGRSLSRVLVAASAVAWRQPVPNRAPLKLVGSIAGLVFAMGFMVLLVNRVRVDLGYGVATVSFGLALTIYVIAWLGISTLLPRSTDDPGALLPGSALVGLTIVVMQSVSQFYLPGHLARAGELYGAIGTTVVTLGWFFILGRAVAVGMSLNPEVYEKYGSLSAVVFSLPVLRVLRRRSARLRRFFDLD